MSERPKIEINEYFKEDAIIKLLELAIFNEINALWVWAYGTCSSENSNQYSASLDLAHTLLEQVPEEEREFFFSQAYVNAAKLMDDYIIPEEQISTDEERKLWASCAKNTEERKAYLKQYREAKDKKREEERALRQQEEGDDDIFPDLSGGED